MANVLEGLVAKGRRVNHIREQREVAFGLADLSTHGELHHRIVKKGGIKTLIHLLTTSRDVEAQRFSALALANTSCAELHRVEIASQENSILHLIEYVNNTEADLLGRQYCAMAMGNLAAEPENHFDISKLGGIEALALLLKFGADEEDLETGRYAAFALSNLAANSKHRKQIVEEGTIASLITMACTDDLNVQRQALNALRGLCVSYEYRAVAVEGGILDPLVLIARSDNLEIIREVAAALNCLSSVPENKAEVADRAISTIIALLLSGDQVVERHACCTMANLTEMIEIHPRILEEDGLPPIISMFSSTDLNCKGEAARALANLSSNEDTQPHLVKDDILHAVVDALEKSEVNCQRFAALCLANLATTVTSQINVVEAGSVRPLINLVQAKDNQLEARRYACLALANLSATVANHPIILQEGGLKAMFSLANSPDVMSQYYVGCTLANLSSNIDNHIFLIEQGGIQTVVTLAYSSDPDVHLQASAALRGLSASESIKMKIVQEGGLEPLSRLLLSSEIELLREVTACFCNLSLGDENKIEITKCGIVPPLITLIQSEDMEISSYCCACLANLAEVSDNQELIASEGAIKPCLWVMRSRYIEVQREGGRLLANLCACDIKKVADIIVKNGGHQLLISFLLSRDIALQRVGAFGIGNLCTHGRHRVTLRKSGVLEPLSTLARSEGVNLEIQRFAMLAIVNLAAEVQNHRTFLDDRILQLMVSLSNAHDAEVRQYAAVCVVNIAKNMDMRNAVTDEGGLEPVLFLARTDDDDVQREVLPAIAALSFVDSIKEDICKNGGLEAVIQDIYSEDEDRFEYSQLACCAIANLAECVKNLAYIVDANVIPLLNKALCLTSSEVRTEAARALGNLSANLDYGEMVISNKSVLPQLVTLLATEGYNCQRMVSMTLSNLASNVKMHSRIMNSDIIDTLVDIFSSSLDPKRESDNDTSHFCLLLVANLATCSDNHTIIIDRMLDLIIKFTRHRDIKCRQNAVIILGNLCSNENNISALYKAGALQIIISFSFPPVDMDTTNAQFQAIAGVRGIAMNRNLRKVLVDGGCVEPLILAAGNEGGLVKDVEVRREAGASLYNLALSLDNGMEMVQSGVVSALISLINVDDVVCQVFAIGSLANLAERESKVQSRLISDGCLAPLINHVEACSGNVETKREVSRCLALFAYNIDSHMEIMCRKSLKCILTLMKIDQDVLCRRLSVHSIANLALFADNHSRLIDAGALDALCNLVDVEDMETKRCIAFALHNFCKNENTHEECEKSEVAKSISSLLTDLDKFTKLHSCLALKYFSVSIKARAQFVEHDGLPQLLTLAVEGDDEQKREAAAALRNISISDRNKIMIVKERGMEVLADFCRSSDDKLCHQACGVLANLAEAPENQELMMKEGILHHLKFFMRSESKEVLRESLRAIANLSSDFNCTEAIASGGGLTPLIRSLSSGDDLCRRFATMSISNLATNRSNQNRIVEEGGIEPLLFIASQCESDTDTSRRHAFFALTNLSASKTHQETLVKCGIISLCFTFLDDSCNQLNLSAALCLSNIASNVFNHNSLQDSDCLKRFIPLLDSTDRDMRLRAVSFLRGLSSNSNMRSTMMRENLVQTLLDLSTIPDIEIQIETLATLCNISLGGYIGDNPEMFLERVDMKNLVSFLCSSNATYRLFGAVSIGNIASDRGLQKTLLEGGSLNPLIHIANVADLETQRCIAYALCNLCAEESNRLMIVREGGLIPLFSLACSDDVNDVLTAVSALRGLANSVEIRREIVVAGGLEPLFSTLKVDYNQECMKEATAAIAALSLNDDNKISIINHADFQFLLKSTILDDVNLADKSIRIIANCCENPQLHAIVTKALERGSGDPISKSFSDVIICRELSRLYANLCSNCSLINNLYTICIPQNLLDMMDIDDDIIVRHVALGLLNLSTEERYHRELDLSERLLHFLLERCQLRSTGTTNDEGVKIRRYACLTIGNLLRSDSFYENLFMHGVVEILLNNLKDDDLETRFNASFGLHQLSMKHEMIPKLRNAAIEVEIINYMTVAPLDLSSHAIATLRNLSLDDHISMMIVNNDGFKVLAHSLIDSTEELKREIGATLCHLTMQKESKLRAANSTALGPIIDLSASTDPESARFAMSTIANIAENQSTHKILLSIDKVFTFLGKRMKSKNLCIKREASRVVSNLLTTEISHKMFFDANGLEPIHIVSRSLDSECQYCIALSLNKLVSNHFYHNEIMAFGTLHVILNLVKLKNNVIAARQATSALRGLSSNKEHKVSIAQEGGVQVAIDVLYSDDFSLQILAAGTLQHLSISSRLKHSMCDDGILEAIVACVQGSNDQKLLFPCAGTLSNISEHSKAKELLWEVQVIDALVKMASFPCTQVQARVVRAFSFMTSIILENQKQNLELKIMEATINLLTSSQKSIASDAATTIGNIAIDAPRQKLLCKLGAFKPLTELLESTLECQLSSCRALSRMMIPDENKSFCVGDKRLLCNLIKLCSSQSEHVLHFTSMAICNLSSCDSVQSDILRYNGIEALLSLTSSPSDRVVKSVTKTLCNLGMHKKNQDRIVYEGGIMSLYSLLKHDNVECVETAVLALCNLCSERQYNKAIIASGSLYYFSAFMKEDFKSTKQKSAAQIIYNLSTSEDCHVPLVKASIVTSIIKLCKSSDISCRRYSIMTLCNLSANKITRREATRGGGLQSGVLMLKDSDDSCNIYACVCLANMANNSTTQNQIVLHGGLPELTNHLLRDDNYVLQKSAIMCLVNLAGNESNHNPILRQGTYRYLTEIWVNSTNESKDFCAFAISNLLSNNDILNHIGHCDGIPPLLSLAKSENDHCRCISLAALRRLASSSDNRRRLMEAGVLKIIQRNGLTDKIEIQREVAAILCNLSRDVHHKADIVHTCLVTLIHLIKSVDSDTINHTAGTLANLSEDDDYHVYISLHNTPGHLMELLIHESCDVRREVSRAISNLLSSYENHEAIIRHGLGALVELSGDSDQECQYNAVLSCRKLVVNRKTHPILLEKGLKNFFSQLKSDNINTKKQVAAIIRDLSANNENKITITTRGGIEEMTSLLKSEHQCLQTFAVATLRHLSWNDAMKRRIMISGAVPLVIKYIMGATQDLMCQIAGLFANLSEALENHIKMVDEGVVSAIITLSRMKNNEIIQDVARTLANLSANEDKQLVIYQQGGMSCLMKLSQINQCVCQRYVSLAIQILSTNAGICRALLKEQNFLSIVKLSNSKCLDYQRTAAVASASISNEDDGKLELTKEGCLQDILGLCNSCDIQIQRDATCAIANISDCYDAHRKLLDNGVVEVMAKLSDSCSDTMVVREISRFFSFISISDEAKDVMMGFGVISILMKFARRSDVVTQRYSTLALCNLSLSRKQKIAILQHHGLIETLVYLTRCPDLEVDRCTVLAITALALGADDISKEKIADAGALKPLLKTLKYPDNEIQQCAALALSALVLGRRETVRVKLNAAEQDLGTILNLLDSPNEECVHHGVYVIGSMMETFSIRNTLVEKGCIDVVTTVAASTSIEIKRACGYIFSLLVEQRQYHENLHNAGALEEIVKLAALVDLECQLYGSFSLVFLASNRDFQVPLVKMGAVRPLVAMMATESEPRHYAGLALLKLADNFENHITIAEEGGIQALLKLGRSRAADEEVQYKAALTVGNLASKAAGGTSKFTHIKNNDNVIGVAAEKYQRDRDSGGPSSSRKK